MIMTSIIHSQPQLILALFVVSSCHEVFGDHSYSTQHIAYPGDDNLNRSPALALTTTAGQKDGYQINNSGNPDRRGNSGQNQGSVCAYYDEHPSNGNKIEFSKRGFERDDKKPTVGGDEFSSGMSSSSDRVVCATYCFTLWMADPRNKSTVTVSKQGCWLLSDEKECQPNYCVSSVPPRPNNTHFCCCSGDLCNVRFQNIYDPTEHTTVTTQPSPLAVGPLQDHSYKKKTIIVALVSVISVSLVIVLLYLTYRLCLTPKPSSPQSSSVARVETPEPLLLEFNIDQLKVEDVLVRGRYSEVRRGWLGDKEVAVKIYQPHHRQYYYNERNAFTQPFMDHENLVRFFGAKEQEDPETNFLQYIIVTEYIHLGTLTSYLKHNTIDWSTLCHMCQGISRGLAYLHADIQKGDLFKPAIAHRDLNTRNILVNPDLTCMLADLGFSVGMIGSKIIKNGVAENAEQATLADVGTLRYMAPEVFDGAVNLRDCEASLKQIDVYALGLVIWEIASRCIDLYQGAPVPDYQLPFQAEAGPHPTFEEMQVLVVKYKTRPRFPEVWKDTSPAVRSLKETIEDCWDTDAEARLTSLCVQERVADMAAVWAHGNKHRGVTPTLNATMNLPEGNTHNIIHNGSAIVSNGMTYIPSYVDRNNQSEGVGQLRHREEEKERNSELISNSLIYKDDDEGMNSMDSGNVTAPLISNFEPFSNETFRGEDGRVRSWLYDQSVSGSTVDTLLPPTPSLEEESTTFGTSHPSTQSEHPPIKANNVTMAINKAVILHPNQGRNPTVERNTHKRSDEELAVSGNVLVGPGKQDSCNNEAEQNNRRGTYSTRSAPPNRNGDSGSYDRIETVESSSLVQNDSLGWHNIRPRNTPIPYFQNHVHSDHVAGGAITPYLTRPKLANISSNRSLYLRLQGEDGNTQVQPPAVQTLDKEEAKTLKHKLSKLIKPKDLGLKFSRMVFRGKYKKSQDIPATDILDVESMAGRGEDINRMPGQYVNNGLDSSPVNRTASKVQPGPVAMEVQLVSGSVVTRACGDTQVTNPVSNQNGHLIAGPQGRLSATNVMRLGVLSNPSHEEIASPSLFPESGDNSLVNDSIYLSKLNQENCVPLKNLAATRLSADYGSMHPVILNQAYGLDGSAETSSEDSKTTRLSVASADIQDTIVLCDYQHSEQERGSDFDLISASFSYSKKLPLNLTVGQNALALNNTGNFNLYIPSDFVASEPAVVSVNNPDILNTVVHSPQNKTVDPLNVSIPMSSTTGHSPHVMVKKCPQDLQGAYSSQNSASCLGLHYHYSDTKGGNSIMHSIHMDAARPQPKEVSAGSAKKSAQLPSKSPQKATTRVSDNTGHNMIEGTAVEPQFLRKTDRLSQSQSASDLEKHNRNLCNTGDADNTSISKREQETDFSKSVPFSKKVRPKSLSLKGHNYIQGRGRSVSSSSLSTSSLPAATTQTRPHVQMSNSDEPLTLVVPSVTIDNFTPLIHNSDDAGRETASIPVTATTSDVSSAVCKIRSAGSAGDSCVSAHLVAGNYITSHDITTGGDESNSCSLTTHHRDSPELTSHTTADSRTNSNTGDKTRSSLKDRSDSSEKIRKRIKTPVSFKKCRLSLYDDRLMTQSMHFVSLYDMEGNDSTKGSGDSNNNSNVAQLCCDSDAKCEHTGEQHTRGHASASKIHRKDYQKMIKSESDLVV